MRPDELIEKLNNKEIDDLDSYSVDLGLSERTIYKRLLKWGYAQDEKGIWGFTGNPEDEPIGIDITQKGKLMMPKKRNEISKTNSESAFNSNDNVNLYAALMHMPKSNLISRAYKTDNDIDIRFRKISKESGLPLNILHSLAIFEFVEKYEVFINECKQQFNSTDK